MIVAWFAGLLPLLLAAAPQQADSSNPVDSVPAPSNIRGAEYPRIHSAKANHEALEKMGIKNTYYESPSTAHEWQSWRRSLYQFAPLLFQDESDFRPAQVGERNSTRNEQ